MKNLLITLTLLLIIGLSQTLSAQFFTKFEHAKSLNQSTIELATHYGQWRIATAYGGGKVANVFGAKLTYGIGDNFDARLSVQRIVSSDLGTITAIGISPKISFAQNRIAIIPSISYASNDGFNEVFVNPSAIVDIIQKDKFSLSFGANYLLPVQDVESGEIAFNLGANINLTSDINIRPNLQLFSPFNDEVIQYIPGLEFAYRFGNSQSKLVNTSDQSSL